MREKNIQQLFEIFLKTNNIPFEREYFCSSGLIDFKIEKNGKVYGVEVKSLQGSLSTTIGQLTLAQKTFSHLYLVAPEEFIHQIKSILPENNLLNNLGLIVFNEGVFTVLREPSPKSYYFNPVKGERSKISEKKNKNMVVNDLDLGILSTFQNRVFDYPSIVKEIKISRTNAHQRLDRLMKMGLVEELSSFNPKQYRVKKIVDLGTKIPIV
jgi:hypothetical protein